MKLEGQNLTGPNEVLVVLPRGESQLVFKCRAVLDYSEFDTLVKPPKPPMSRVPGKEAAPDTKNKTYQTKMNEYSQLRIHWMFLKSLQATEGLSWETVDMQNPQTWQNYVTEMKEVGLSDIEQSRLLNGVMEANSLDESKIDEARERFLLGQQPQEENE